MAEKQFEAEDPMALTGMVLPLPQAQAERAQEEMAECFIEEFARLGHSDALILGLFKDPFYQATHAVYRSRGEGYVRDLIARVRGADETAQEAKEVVDG